MSPPKPGIKVDGWSISSAWLDYDRDGCVDLFVGRYVKFDPKYRNFYPADNYPGPLDYAADTNRLYHNNCNGTFTDVTDKSGIGAYKGRTMGVTAADFDGDGYPDIYVANDKTENFLFHNKHDGTFEEVAGDLGVAYGQNGENTSAMGPVFADIDGDGRLDLWVTDSKYNRLMRNTGANGFEDIGPSSGISQATAQYTSWGSGIYDFDNDGWLDILVFHGGLIHLVPQEQSLFRGLGNGKFADVSRDAGPVLDVKTVSRGACFADYDNDGKVDAFVVNLGAPATLLHNVTQNSNHWLTVKLKGKEKQSRRHRSAPGTARRRPQADRRAHRRIRLSLAGRRPHSLRSGRRRQGGQTHDPLAQRARTGSGESCRRSCAHGGGAVDAGVAIPAARASGGWSRLPASSPWLCSRSRPSLRQDSRRRFRRNAIYRRSKWCSRPDGRLLYVVCQDSDEVRVVDVASSKVMRSIPVGHIPRGIALSPDGRRLYVTNAWSDTVSVIDTATLQVVQTLPTGFEPTGVVV